jgi:hypothetical protein
MRVFYRRHVFTYISFFASCRRDLLAFACVDKHFYHEQLAVWMVIEVFKCERGRHYLYFRENVLHRDDMPFYHGRYEDVWCLLQTSRPVPPSVREEQTSRPFPLSDSYRACLASYRRDHPQHAMFDSDGFCLCPEDADWILSRLAGGLR